MHIMEPTVKFTSLCVMVWGVIGIGYNSPLLILTESVPAPVYIKVLGQFIPHCNRAFGSGQWVLMQDGAPPQTAHETLEYISQHCGAFPSWPRIPRT
jgi:hypothetical protein